MKVAVSGRSHLSCAHQPEVAQLAPAVVVEQHVMALQVAVHDGRGLRVQMGHRARHLQRQADGLAPLKLLAVHV